MSWSFLYFQVWWSHTVSILRSCAVLVALVMYWHSLQFNVWWALVLIILSPVGHGSFERLHEKESWERVMKRSIWLKRLKSKRLHEKEWSMKKRIWLKDILGVESLHERECMKRSVRLFKHPIYVYILIILRAGDYMRRSHEKEWWHLRLWRSLYKLRDRSLHGKECMNRIRALLFG